MLSVLRVLQAESASRRALVPVLLINAGMGNFSPVDSVEQSTWPKVVRERHCSGCSCRYDSQRLSASMHAGQGLQSAQEGMSHDQVPAVESRQFIPVMQSEFHESGHLIPVMQAESHLASPSPVAHCQPTHARIQLLLFSARLSASQKRGFRGRSWIVTACKYGGHA